MLCVCGFALFGCSQEAREATYAARAPAGWVNSVAGCTEPHEGCACAGNQPPVACQPDAAQGARATDTNMCQEGTRYCQQGRFGACEDVHRYARPAAPIAALVDSHAAAAPCSDCEPNCYRVSDDLDPAEGALGTPIANGVVYHSSGAGLTLAPRPGAIVDPPPATVPDGTLFLSVRDGLSASVTQTSAVHPAQSEVYLLLDRSETMAEETAALQDSFDTGALLDPHVSCSHGNAAFATSGVAGALRCMIDTPRLGGGMFRDIPFVPYGSDTSEITYRHLADSSTDLTRTKNALLALDAAAPSGDSDLAGSQIQALYAVATGKGMFMGIGRESVPDAVACRSGRFGYPCFRRSNQPIVVMVTDAPLHNGPDPAYDYDSDVLHRLRGTVPGQTAIPANNDSWNSAFMLTTDAASSLGVFYGSTTRLTAQISGAITGCGANDHAKDAVFRFDVDAPGALGTKLPVQLSTEGSRFDTVLSVIDHLPIEPESIAIDPQNELFETAYDLGDVSARLVSVSGNTAGAPGYIMDADYQGSLFGTCGANTLSRDAVFAFNVDGASETVPIELQLDMGAAHAVLSIYQEGAGQLLRWPARTSTLVASDNSDASPAHVFEIPSGAGNEYLSVLGDTTGLGDDYDPIELGGADCGPDADSMDVAFKIHVDGTHRLRFDTEGSAFDTVLSLHSAPPDGTPGSYITCDDNGVAETTASAIEQMLMDGDYYLVLKGKLAGDQGQYALTVRDLAAAQTSEQGCDLGAGTGDPAIVNFDATPGETYYALVKGDTPADEGAFLLQVHDMRGDDPHSLQCDGPSGPGGSSQLDVDLASGTYYAVLKGHASSDAGDYRLVIGGAASVEEAFALPTYADTVDVLGDGQIRVATVLSCASGDAACDDAQAQATELAHDTAGVVRVAANAADVPAQVIKAVQLIESFDVVRAELRFSPDANPGFVKLAVAALADPNNGCAEIGTDAEFHDCVPGATPSFALSLTNPALSPVAPSSGAFGAYQMTLRISAERDGSSVLVQDVPVLVAPSGVAPPSTYSSGSYYQDFDSRGCRSVNQRASWDRLTFDADVRPDTRVTIYACTADSADQLKTCGAGAPASGYKRVVSVSAGSGAGTACTTATQPDDCPNGYCSPYTGICNELEGASCTNDMDCPGALPGSCRAGASFAALGKTCAVPDGVASPVDALGDENNYRPFMRVRFELDSLTDGSRTPSVFFWETRYRCRNVE